MLEGTRCTYVYVPDSFVDTVNLYGLYLTSTAYMLARTITTVRRARKCSQGRRRVPRRAEDVLYRTRIVHGFQVNRAQIADPILFASAYTITPLVSSALVYQVHGGKSILARRSSPRRQVCHSCVYSPGFSWGRIRQASPFDSRSSSDWFEQWCKRTNIFCVHNLTTRPYNDVVAEEQIEDTIEKLQKSSADPNR